MLSEVYLNRCICATAAFQNLNDQKKMEMGWSNVNYTAGNNTVAKRHEHRVLTNFKIWYQKIGMLKSQNGNYKTAKPKYNLVDAGFNKKYLQ